MNSASSHIFGSLSLFSSFSMLATTIRDATDPWAAEFIYLSPSNRVRIAQRQNMPCRCVRIGAGHFWRDYCRSQSDGQRRRRAAVWRNGDGPSIVGASSVTEYTPYGNSCKVIHFWTRTRMRSPREASFTHIGEFCVHCPRTLGERKTNVGSASIKRSHFRRYSHANEPELFQSRRSTLGSEEPLSRIAQNV